MAWTAPRTWVAGELVTAAIMNTHVRDNLLTLATWTSYTATLTASTTSPTLGTGSTSEGYYLSTGQLVVASFYIAFGTTSAPGEGNYRIALPVSAVRDQNRVIGGGYLYDLSETDRYTVTLVRGAAAGVLNLVQDERTGPGIVTHASPFTWADGDVIAGRVVYQIA